MARPTQAHHQRGERYPRPAKKNAEILNTPDGREEAELSGTKLKPNLKQGLLCE